MGSRAAYIHRACGRYVYETLRCTHYIGISIGIHVSRCGGAERAGTTIYDASIREELEWVVYNYCIGILYVYTAEPTKVFGFYLDQPPPPSSFGREGLPPHPLPAYRPSREKWISSSKTPAAAAYLRPNGLLRLIQRRTTRHIYIPIYTRTGISRAERSHKPTVYCSLFIYIYMYA